MRIVTILLICLVPVMPVAPGAAQAQRLSDRVLDAMQIVPLFEILQHEAVASGRDLGAEMMPGRDLAGWEDTLRRLNDPARVLPDFRDAFAAALPDGPDGPGDAILAYLAAQPGRRIVALELSARAALAEPGIEDAARDRFARDRAADSDHARAVDRFIAVNDLVDRNVQGALAANAAFLTGLRDGADVPGAPGSGDVFGDVFGDVWAQEPAIRDSTRDWLHGFVSLAYRPLDPAEMAAHLAFSASPAGQDMNDAIFAAFDVVVVALSYDTGTALARLLASQDL